MANDTADTTAGGNTKPQPRSRKWCFTLNNYDDTDYNSLILELTQRHGKYIVGKEVGEQGTPHLLGYVEFKNAISFSSISKINKKIHWEKAKGSRKQNIEYCSKDNCIKTNFPVPINIRILLKYENVVWKNWLKQVIDIVNSKPDDRTIHWFWEPTGNTGKSFLAKYLYLSKNCVICLGKNADILNQVKTWLENNPDDDIDVILLDIPRTNLDYVSYNTIEQLKNGLAYSGKYEGGTILLDNVHVIAFANEPPKTNKLSQDRWNIVNILDNVAST